MIFTSSNLDPMADDEVVYMEEGTDSGGKTSARPHRTTLPLDKGIFSSESFTGPKRNIFAGAQSSKASKVEIVFNFYRFLCRDISPRSSTLTNSWM